MTTTTTMARGALRDPKNVQKVIAAFRRKPDIEVLAARYFTSPSTMRMILRAHVPAEFDAYLAQRKKDAAVERETARKRKAARQVRAAPAAASV